MPTFRLVAVILALIGVGGLLWTFAGEDSDGGTVQTGDVSIAIVGPMSGPSKTVGEEMVAAAEVFLEALNDQGGVNGLTVGLKIFDDANNPNKATSIATQIVNDREIVGVVGHALSSTSLAAAPIYQSAGLAAVTPSATNPGLTENFPNYFSVIYSDRTQGRFMADYAHQGLNAKDVVVLVSPGPYPDALAQSFIARAPMSGLNVRHALLVPDNSLSSDVGVGQLFNELNPHLNEDTLLVLMAERKPAAEIVRVLRDNGLKNRFLGPDALGSKSFAGMFTQLPSEIAKPGFYTTNMFVSVPFISDTANASAHRLLGRMERKIKKIESWIAPFAHDAALLIVEALRRGAAASEDGARSGVIKHLAAMSAPDLSVSGATGHIQLDAAGAAVRPVVIGLFNGGLVSSLVQLQIDPTDPQAPPKRTAIDYSGIKPTSLGKMDFITGEAEVGFEIWFRYQGDLDPENIEFDNAITPIELTEPVQQREWNGTNYVRYNARGTFMLNYSRMPRGFANHVVDIAFHHREKSRGDLIFVADKIGLSGTRGGGYVSYLNEGMKEAGGWRFANATLSSRFTAVETKGDPLFLAGSGQAVQQAGLLFAGEIGPQTGGIRHLLDSPFTWLFALLFIALMVAARSFEKKPPFDDSPRAAFFGFLVLALITLALVEVSVLRVAGAMEGRPMIGALLVLFDIVWWMVPAYLICMAVERFLWVPLETKTGQKVPKVIKGFLIFLIFIFASFGVIAFVFNQQITSLLATSGVLAMIIGLAIQMNISNIFSGIALNVERPFRPGDWVRIGDAPVAKVLDVSWRSIKLETFQNTVISIPNAAASEQHIENYSYPNDNYRIFQILHFGLEHSPERITRLLYDALHLVVPVDGRKRLGLTWVKYNGVDEHGQKFLVAFDCTDRMLKNSQEHVALICIYRVLAQSGIHPSTSHLDLHVRRATVDLGEAALTADRLIEHVPIFAPLGKGEKQALAEAVETREFAAGEVVVSEGEAGDSMFLIAEGVVAIEVSIEGQEERLEVARLGSGDFFGEMALLTGDPRTATVVARDKTLVYEVTKSGLAPLMESTESLGQDLSEVLAERQMRTSNAVDDSRAYEDVKEEISRGLLSRIQNFFRLRISKPKVAAEADDAPDLAKSA